MNYENFIISHSKHPGELADKAFAETLLAELSSPLTDDQANGLRSLANTEGAQIGSAFRQDEHDKLETAQTAKNHLEDKRKTISARLAAVEQELAKYRIDPGSVILLVFYALCFAACVVAEYDVSSGTITWALSLKPGFTATMLALACAVSPVILKWPITQLIWEPWQQARSQADHPDRKRRYVILAIFLLGIATLTIYTIALLADARSIISHIKDVLAVGGDISGIDRTVVNRSIYFLSIALAVNGSLFFILMMEEKNKLAAYCRSRCAVLYQRFQQWRLGHQLDRVEPRLNVIQAAWQRIDERVAHAIQHYRDRLALLIAQKCKGPRQPRSYRELVSETLDTSLSG